jgi:hypothetical protein
MLLPAPSYSREYGRRDEKPANWQAARQTNSLPSEGKQERILQKMNEQYGNLIENKGPLWKARGEAGMS